MIELELLAQQVGANERTLRRAVNEGTLRGRRPTPRRLKVSATEKQYIRRSWPLLSSLREVLRTEQNVRFALLFGSAARGDDTPDSDLDLLVEMRDSDLERVVDLSSKLEALLGRRVDLLRVEEAEADPALLADAVAEGRVVVDREGRWADLHDREAALRSQGRRQDKRRTRDALAKIDGMLTT